MCIDVLNGTAGMFSWVSNASHELMWPNKVGGLANELLTHYGVHIPFDFCNKEPTTWGDELSMLLQTKGYLLNATTGTCPRAEMQIQDLLISAATAQSSQV